MEPDSVGVARHLRIKKTGKTDKSPTTTTNTDDGEKLTPCEGRASRRRRKEGEKGDKNY